MTLAVVGLEESPKHNHMYKDIGHVAAGVFNRLPRLAHLAKKRYENPPQICPKEHMLQKLGNFFPPSPAHVTVKERVVFTYCYCCATTSGIEVSY